jgi:hypothetical protein
LTNHANAWRRGQSRLKWQGVVSAKNLFLFLATHFSKDKSWLGQMGSVKGHEKDESITKQLPPNVFDRSVISQIFPRHLGQLLVAVSVHSTDIRTTKNTAHQCFLN